MKRKLEEKEMALKLRSEGLSYSEILDKVQVSQSSLSLWLKNITLSEEQKKRLTEKGDDARKLGSLALRNQRLIKTSEIIKKSSSEIKGLSTRDLMLIGATLYWAEGSKQKEHNPSKQVIFSNSDPKMIRLYLKWLDECLKISSNNIVFEIYIHETHKKTIQELSTYWSKATGFPVSKFNKVYYKRNKVHSFRKNRGVDYGGVLRVSVIKSTDLNRKIMGWINGICLQSGVV